MEPKVKNVILSGISEELGQKKKPELAPVWYALIQA